MAAAGAVAAISVIWLVIGIDARYLRIATLLLGSAAIATLVVLLPASWRARSALLVTAFLTAAGFLPTLMKSSDDAGSHLEQPRVNAQYLADLIRKGPFTEALPSPLLANGLTDVGISDPTAAARLDAVQLVVKVSSVGRAQGYGEVAAFASLETYGSTTDAGSRAKAQFDDLRKRYEGLGGYQGASDNFAIAGDTFWTCGGHRGYVYAEVTISPSPNAFLPLCSGTVSSLLRYADRMTALATAR